MSSGKKHEDENTLPGIIKDNVLIYEDFPNGLPMENTNILGQIKGPYDSNILKKHLRIQTPKSPLEKIREKLFALII